jgi:hypothetical protein
LAGIEVSPAGIEAPSAESYAESLPGAVTRILCEGTTGSAESCASEDIGFDTIMMKERRRARRFASFLFMEKNPF